MERVAARPFWSDCTRWSGRAFAVLTAWKLPFAAKCHQIVTPRDAARPPCYRAKAVRRRKEISMGLILLILVLVLLFGGGGGYYGYRRWGTGGGVGIVGLVVIILLVMYLFGGMRM
jgi:hypothetical protein